MRTVKKLAELGRTAIKTREAHRIPGIKQNTRTHTHHSNTNAQKKKKKKKRAFLCVANTG